MNFKSVIIVLAAVIAGTLGGAVTYQMAVPADGAPPGAGDSVVLGSPGQQSTGQKARQERRKVKFAPCKPPAKLEGKRCVTDVVRTVVVPGQSSAQAAQPAQVAAQSAPRTAAAPSAPAPQPASASGSDWNDDGRGDDDSGDDDDDDGRSDDDDDSGTNTGTHTRTRSHTGGTHTGSHD